MFKLKCQVLYEPWIIHNLNKGYVTKKSSSAFYKEREQQNKTPYTLKNNKNLGEINHLTILQIQKRNFSRKIGWQSWDSNEEVGSIRWKRWEYENEYQCSGLPNETTEATTPRDALSIET